MTPKEKAIELVDKFTVVGLQQRAEGYQCAIIAVDEILEVTAPCIDKYEPYYQELDDNQTQLYWQEVKQELEKL